MANPAKTTAGKTALKLKEIRKASGLTVKYVSDHVGLPLSTYASYENKFKGLYLPVDLVRKMAPLIAQRNGDVTALFALAGVGQLEVVKAETSGARNKNPVTGGQYQPPVNHARPSFGDAAIQPRPVLEATLPVRGFLKQGEHGFYFDNGHTSDFVSRPAELEGVESAYAMQLRDYSMPPFEPGWYATFDPTKPVRAGDLVALYLQDGQAMFKKLVKINQTDVVVRQYDPAKDLTFKMSDVDKIHRFATIHAERP